MCAATVFGLISVRQELVRSPPTPPSSGAKVLAAPPSLLRLSPGCFLALRQSNRIRVRILAKEIVPLSREQAFTLSPPARSLLPLRFYIRVVKWLMRRGERGGEPEIAGPMPLPICQWTLMEERGKREGDDRKGGSRVRWHFDDWQTDRQIPDRGRRTPATIRGISL